MSKLNERNENTKGIIHLLVTPLCDRNCAYCCNKQYDLKDIPIVTDEELREAHTLLLTGGEPFKYSNPPVIAHYYKKHYPNIQKIYAYTNANELLNYLDYAYYDDFIYDYEENRPNIDGVSVSIKNEVDKEAFDELITRSTINKLSSNRLYVFDKKLIPDNLGNFTLIHRKWQKDFEPASDSIFRRL